MFCYGVYAFSLLVLVAVAKYLAKLAKSGVKIVIVGDREAVSDRLRAIHEYRHTTCVRDAHHLPNGVHRAERVRQLRHRHDLRLRPEQLLERLDDERARVVDRDRPGKLPQVDIEVGADGAVTVFSGTMAMGQGLETSYGQLVSEVLGIPMERIRLVQGDTDRANGVGSVGSRSLFVGGTAAVVAFADRVCAERGVRHGKLNLISVEGDDHHSHRHPGTGRCAKGEAHVHFKPAS